MGDSGWGDDAWGRCTGEMMPGGWCTGGWGTGQMGHEGQCTEELRKVHEGNGAWEDGAWG